MTDLTIYSQESRIRTLLKKSIPGYALLLIILIIEVIFKANHSIGLWAYAGFFVLSSIYLIFISNNHYLTYALIIPILRIAQAGISLEPGLKTLLSTSILLAIMLIRLNFSEHKIAGVGFGFHNLMELARKNQAHLILITSALAGIGAGMLASGFMPIPKEPLLILLYASLVEEFYFRGILMTFDKSMSVFLIIPFLYAALFYQASMIAALIVLIFNFFLNAMYFKYQTIYFPMLSHALFTIFLAFSKTF